MMLPKEAIEEFKVLYKKNFGEDLTDQVASDKANRLVNLYCVVYGERLGLDNNTENNKNATGIRKTDSGTPADN